MPEQNKNGKRRLSIILAALFIFALIMGPGPGMYLVNPDASSEIAPATVLGMPILYAWAVFWYFVEAAIVLVAYFKLWSDEEEENS